MGSTSVIEMTEERKFTILFAATILAARKLIEMEPTQHGEGLRPRVIVDAARIGRLRAQGRTVREIAAELGYSRSLVHD